MPADPNVDAILAAIEKLKSDDVAEDAAYETTIAGLEVQVAALVAERDALTVERDALVLDQTTTLAELVAHRDSLTTFLAALDARITALGG